MSNNDNWKNNVIQFAQLIAELEAAGVFNDSKLWVDLRQSMKVHEACLAELVDRASAEWDKYKEDPKPYKIKIIWGGVIAIEERPICNYEFSTQQEMDAFIEGMNESEGWEDWDIITEDDYTHCDKCGERIPIVLAVVNPETEQWMCRKCLQKDEAINTPCPHCGREENGKWYVPCPSDDCPSLQEDE